LDGGRLLHAFLWRRYNDRLRATKVVTRAGRGMGVVLVALGFVEMAIGTDAASGLWLALVGWFLMSAAKAEGMAAELALTGLAPAEDRADALVDGVTARNDPDGGTGSDRGP